MRPQPTRPVSRPLTFTATRRASYAGFVVQAIVNNLAPLLFIAFHTRLGLGVAQLGALASLNFAVQLVTDLAAIRVIDRVGYRRPMLVAHAAATAGLVLLALLPQVMDPMWGLAVAVSVYAVGGGLLEVLVSPVVEHLPSPAEGKASAMALLHSFYCWGQLAVVMLSTGALALIGLGAWPVLPLIWALVPAVNGLVFARVPFPETVGEESRTPLRRLAGSPVFLAALVLMVTGGAAELTMAQWSSFFAESATGVPKEIGDLMGPGLFALLMGLGRMAYGLAGERVDLRVALAVSSAGAVICYLVAATAWHPVVSLLGCAMTGLCISLLWPGTISLTAARFPAGGAAMFAVLALAGDGGATVGPALAGRLAGLAEAGGPLSAVAAALPDDGGTGLRAALMVCAGIPLVFTLTVLALRQPRRP
ncbi:sugar MFS transporter [Actinomyces slackii]|uniref:Major Facilitator Superfamily n=1 Tax=Actinomyces slackii TaxID=52774 RepID=A0A448KCN0_9ACTO|nr:MFS transporter [Actinomyces slackii]VEG74689.1 Major Facilitator Superfamily [Actinomyces slackii]